MSDGFNVLKPGGGQTGASGGSGFSVIKRPLKGQFYTPDIMEIMVTPPSRQTRSGHITSDVAGYDNYVPSGYKFKAYSYLATGRFFSTKVNPSEYGDGDAFDPLIVIVHTSGVPEEALDMLRPTAVVSLQRLGYTDPGTLYRIETGNPYPDHVELKIVPLLL